MRMKRKIDDGSGEKRRAKERGKRGEERKAEGKGGDQKLVMERQEQHH